MKKAIVTGSNGFIGSNVCKRLCADGVKVFAVVKDEKENIDNIKNLSGIEIVYCELDEIETLADKISDRDIDVFYHFAWVGSAGPLRCDENIQLQNALWTARALRTADGMQCKKFVNAGSIMEKETYTAVYTQESKPGLPYIYGAGKLIARAICKPIANSLSIDLCWAVITNAYGVGELSPRFVNSTIRKIIANEPLQFTAATQNYDFKLTRSILSAAETQDRLRNLFLKCSRRLLQMQRQFSVMFRLQASICRLKHLIQPTLKPTATSSRQFLLPRVFQKQWNGLNHSINF